MPPPAHGKPIVVGYSKGDVHDIWAQTIARTIAMGGGSAKDILQIAYGYGLFTGGLGLPLRRRGPRLHCHPDVGRQYRPPTADDARSGRNAPACTPPMR